MGALGEEPDGGSPSEWIEEGGEGRAWIGFGGSVPVGRPGGKGRDGDPEKKWAENKTKKGRKSEPGGRKLLQIGSKVAPKCSPEGPELKMECFASFGFTF